MVFMWRMAVLFFLLLIVLLHLPAITAIIYHLHLECNISFLKQVNVGDELTAEAKEIHNGKSTGVYSINVTNQNNQQVALFKGTCFRTGKNLI